MRNKQALAVLVALAVASLACSMSAIPAKISAQTDPRMSPALKNELEDSPFPAPMEKTLSARVTAFQSLYIRSEPNPYAEIVGYLIHDEDVVVYACAGDWAEIGNGRYVNSLYLSVPCQ